METSHLIFDPEGCDGGRYQQQVLFASDFGLQTEAFQFLNRIALV